MGTGGKCIARDHARVKIKLDLICEIPIGAETHLDKPSSSNKTNLMY